MHRYLLYYIIYLPKRGMYYKMQQLLQNYQILVLGKDCNVKLGSDLCLLTHDWRCSFFPSTAGGCFFRAFISGSRNFIWWYLMYKGMEIYNRLVMGCSGYPLGTLFLKHSCIIFAKKLFAPHEICLIFPFFSAIFWEMTTNLK